MQPVLIRFRVDENELLRRVTLREYCLNDISKQTALKTAL